MPKFDLLPAIEGGPGGCLHCGRKHPVLPMDALIAVGFGDASVTRDDETVYEEPRATRPDRWSADGKSLEPDPDWHPPSDDDYWTAQRAEEMAADDPDHDWRIHLVAPLSERHYQRQGERHWVLYQKGDGFA